MKKGKEKTTEIATKPINFKSDKRQDSDSIKVATPSKNYQNRIEKVRIGIFTHEILAKINTKDDVEKTLESYLLEGIITEEEKEEVGERIFNILHHQDYSKYFVENQIVINERDIMISENGESKIYRPDRLIATEKGFIILDFKTGKEEEKHQLQLEQYRNALEKLGKKVVETVVVYG